MHRFRIRGAKVSRGAVCRVNTHKLASLYEAFPAEQARRTTERMEIHHTPKHGSWLNVAEIELSVSQCLNR